MQSAIPEGVATHAIEPKRLLSAAGEPVHNNGVTLAKMSFPEFASKITSINIDLIVMEDHGHSTYDIIIGRDLMT